MLIFAQLMLTDRISKLLNQMAMLSDGTSAGTGGGAALGSNKPGSQIPTTESLFTQYEAMFAQVEPYELRKLRMILLKGEEDLDAAQYGRKVMRKKETREQRSYRISNMYEGWTPVEVAFAEDLSEAVIRKFRKEHGRNQQDGST
jgi:hypothetical protein